MKRTPTLWPKRCRAYAKWTKGGWGLLPRITTNCRPCCCAQVFWQRATSDLDLINSEVGLTAKHQARAGGKARQGKESRRFPLRNREGDGRSRRAAHSFNCGCRAVCWGKLWWATRGRQQTLRPKVARITTLIIKCNNCKCYHSGNVRAIRDSRTNRQPRRRRPILIRGIVLLV